MVSTNGQMTAGQAQKVLLGTGLSFWRGTINEEYLTQLKPWSKAAQVYREMMDDVVVGALLDAIKTPLLSTEFNVDAVSDSPEDVAAAQFLESNLFNMPDMEWREHVEEVLDFLGFGFALAEQVMSKHTDGSIRLHTLLPIGQETIADWGTELSPLGNPLIVRQRDPTMAKLREAPMAKMLHFTFRGRKRNPFGNSLLRSIYRPWYFKKNLEVIEAIGAERDVGNVPMAKLGETRLTDGERTDLKNALEAFRMDETSYLILPPEVDIKAYGGGSKVYNVRLMIRDWQNLIRQRFFAGFIALGTEQIGTQALAREMTTFFSLVIRSVQIRLLEVWKRQLITNIFRFNKFSINQLPILRWRAPGKENMQSISQAIAVLVGSGVLENTPEVENHVRRAMGLPERVDKPAVGETRGDVPEPAPGAVPSVVNASEMMVPAVRAWYQ